MSSDTAIYICNFFDGFRVAYTTATNIENIFFYFNNKMKKKYLKRIFKKSPLFMLKELASQYAINLANEIGYTEYGIIYIIEDEFYDIDVD